MRTAVAFVVLIASLALLTPDEANSQSPAPAPLTPTQSTATTGNDERIVPRGNEKPSFDCAQAKTAAARLICADAELAQLDGELGSAFQKRKAQISVPDQSKFVSEQLAWIRDRNARCGVVGKNDVAIEVLASSKPCMASVMRERIAFLSQTEATTEVAPAGVQQETTSQSIVPSRPPLAPTNSGQSVTKITSLSDYAKRIKHRWVKYDQNGNQTSYIDIASVTRTGDTLTVLDMQDWNPPIEFGATGEYLGSSLHLVKYDCGSTPRSMIMAGVVFRGHMGSGTQQDGAADVPKEPPDGWHVMEKASGMLKEREMACNSVSSNVAPDSQVASSPAPAAQTLAAEKQNADDKADEASDDIMRHKKFLAAHPTFVAQVKTLIEVGGYECPAIRILRNLGPSPYGVKLDALCGADNGTTIYPKLHYAVYPERSKVDVCKEWGFFSMTCE